MRIPRHWATESGRAESPRGQVADLTGVGWSDASHAEARQRAVESLARLTARVRGGEPFPSRYPYATRPLREEIVREIADGGDGPSALLTRNAYGALVLNTARVMFVDVDQPEGLWSSLRRGLARLRGGARQQEPPERLTGFLAGQPGWRVRVYRTRGGWRYLVTHDLFDPTADHTRNVLQALGCDPQYVQLTHVQECFRARLTPKPWRCGSPKPPGRHPREDRDLRERFASWRTAYELASSGFATCELVAELGDGHAAGQVRQIVELHDRETRATSGLPLA